MQDVNTSSHFLSSGLRMRFRAQDGIVPIAEPMDVLTASLSVTVGIVLVMNIDTQEELDFHIIDQRRMNTMYGLDISKTRTFTINLNKHTLP